MRGFIESNILKWLLLLGVLLAILFGMLPGIEWASGLDFTFGGLI